MGIKYHYEVKDQKLAQRFQNLNAKNNRSDTAKPGMRAPKKLTKKEAARLAAKQAETES